MQTTTLIHTDAAQTGDSTMFDILFTLQSGDKIGRRICFDSGIVANALLLLDQAEHECMQVEQLCMQPVTAIDIQPSRLSKEHHIQNRRKQRWTNICGKIFYTTGGIRDEMESCLVDCQHTNFGIKKLVMSVHGNFMLSQGSTTALFRGFNSCSVLFDVMQHVFKPHSCIHATLHMLVCSINIEHIVFIHSKILDKQLFAEHEAPVPRWRAALIDSMDNVHGMKSLRVENFDANWLQSMGATCVSSLRMQISSHGSVNLFITPTPDTVLVKNFETQLDQFCSFFADLCRRFT
jgi:hypothetical protein